MGRLPQRSPDQADCLLSIRVPGWLKNEIADQAERAGVSISSYLGAIVHRVARHDLGLPDPPPTHGPVPGVVEVLRAYVSGDPVLTPCGRHGDCDGLNIDPKQIGSVKFCAVCDIRFS
jgi:hypothetical protein